MTKYNFIIISFTLFIFCQCSHNNDEDEPYKSVQYNDTDENNHFKNFPLPQNVDTLKILSIGNSFSIDGLTLLPNILGYADIKTSKYSIYLLTRSSCSLEQYANAIFDNINVETNISDNNSFSLQHMGGCDMFKNILSTYNLISIKEVLSQPWDIIVLQQYSRLSANYSSFEPHLQYIINQIKKNCTNEKVTFAWHQTWSYASTSNNMPKGKQGFINIAQTTIEMINKNGIDIIIPVGTTIQNLRNTKYNNSMDLTRDGVHLDTNLGRFAAALTWYKTLFKPISHQDEISFTKSELMMDTMIIDSITLSDCIKYVEKSCENPFCAY